MKVVITGGLGFLGLRLARRLLELGELGLGEGGRAAIDTLVLADREVPASRSDWMDSRVELAACDVADRDLLFGLIDRDDVSVFHLAAIVSAEAERDPELAWRVNVEGGRNVLDAVRRRAGCQRVVVTSTYAVFGGNLPDVCGDDTKLTPQSTYGMTKAILELLVADYSRRGAIDGRVARLPTVIVRPGAANAAASSVASAIFREPLAGRPYQVPVTEDTRMAFTGARSAVEGLIALHEVSGAHLGNDRSVCFPSRAASIREMVECLQRVAEGRRLGPISFGPDSVAQAIVSSWPYNVDAARAIAAGVPVPRRARSDRAGGS